MNANTPLLLLLLVILPFLPAGAQVAVKAGLLYHMTGDLKPLREGIVLCGRDGTPAEVGASSAARPARPGATSPSSPRQLILTSNNVR